MALARRVAESGPAGERLTDLARSQGISSPTAHRMLAALVDHGLLKRDENTQRYRLGDFVLTWGILSDPTLWLRRVCRPHVEAIASRTGDSVYLIARSGSHAVCIDRAEGAYPIKAITLEVGAHRMLGIGAGGLAMLALLPQEERAKVYSQRASDLRQHASLSTDAMERMVAQTRARGYAVSAGLVVEGVTGVSVALRLPGEALAAISLVAINERLSPSRIAGGVRLLKAGAAQIENDLRQRSP